MLDWIREHDVLLGWLAVASAVMFVGSIVLVPWLVARIPADHFASPKRRVHPWVRKHPVVRVLLMFGKSLLGLVLIVAGIAMLVIPGQGLLTIVVGILLVDFPGKFRLERWAVSRGPVLRSINWLRARAHRPPLQLDARPPATPAASPQREAG